MERDEKHELRENNKNIRENNENKKYSEKHFSFFNTYKMFKISSKTSGKIRVHTRIIKNEKNKL